jgi:hypothetical protein
MVKVKESCYRPEQAQRVDRGIALSFLDPGARRGWVVSTTPRYPLYRRLGLMVEMLSFNAEFQWSDILTIVIYNLYKTDTYMWK